MDLSFSLLFAVIAGGAFYFLVRPHSVRSAIMLRFVFIDLGLALCSAAAVILYRDEARIITPLAVAVALAYLFLGAAVMSLVFVVFPVKVKRTKPLYAQRNRFVDREAEEPVATEV